MGLKKDISHAYQNQLTLSVYWGMQLLLLPAIGYFLWRGDVASAGSTVFILLLMLIPSILKRRYRFYIPFTLEFSIVLFVFLTLFLGVIAQFYDRIPFWDKFLHFQSGLLLGATGFVLVYTLNEHKKIDLGLSPGFIAFFAITFSITVGTLWEIGEFMSDSLFGSYWSNGLADTIWDLVADSVGALIISIIGYFWMYRHKRLPLTPWLLHMVEQAKDTMEPR